ncbi:MAG: hypothetical protein HRO68_08140 [Nitrosopumilus sp.]|nr:hypothetical protein [Nitrosopumilus sp.]
MYRYFVFLFILLTGVFFIFSSEDIFAEDTDTESQISNASKALFPEGVTIQPLQMLDSHELNTIFGSNKILKSKNDQIPYSLSPTERTPYSRWESTSNYTF